MLSYQYAYLLGDLFIALPIWLLLFLFRPDLRHKMMALSIMGAVAGPISEIWYLQDYWHPQIFTGTKIGIEDVIFGFVAAGVSSVLYEELFGKRYARRHTRKHHWIMLAFPLVVALLYAFNHILPMYRINSIYASFIAFVSVAITMILIRKDLAVASLMSGVLCGALFLLCYIVLLFFFPEIFQRMWLLQNISGITVHSIPIEELLWAFGCGMFAGPVYEFYAGLLYKKSYKKATQKVVAKKRLAYAKTRG